MSTKPVTAGLNLQDVLRDLNQDIEAHKGDVQAVNPKALSAAVNQFETHASEPARLTALAKALATLASNNENRNAIAKAGGLQATVMALNTDKLDTDFVDAAMGLLGQFSKNDGFRDDIAKLGGIKALIKIMLKFIDHQNIVDKCLSALANLGYNSDANVREIITHGGIAATLKVMQRWKDAPGTLQLALVLLNNCMYGSMENKLRVGKEGGQEIINVLQRHYKDAKTFNAANRALGNLSVADPNIRLLVDAHAVKHIVTGMETHPLDITCQQTAIDVIGNFASIQDDPMQQQVRLGQTKSVFNIICDEQGAAKIIGVIKGTSEIQLLMSGMDALANLANDDTAIQHMLKMGIVPVVVDAMAAYDWDEELMVRTVRLLATLTFNKEGAKEIVVRDGIQVLLSGIESHIEEPEFLLSAVIALKNIAQEPDFRAEIDKLGGIETVLAALDRHLVHRPVVLEVIYFFIRMTQNEFASESIATKGMHTLLKAINGRAQDAEFLARAFVLLGHLAFHHPNLKIITQYGGIGLILDAISNHPESRELLSRAVQTLDNIAMASQEHAKIIRDEGGMDAIKAIMEAYGDDAELTKNCKAALISMTALETRAAKPRRAPLSTEHKGHAIGEDPLAGHRNLLLAGSLLTEWSNGGPNVKHVYISPEWDSLVWKDPKKTGAKMLLRDIRVIRDGASDGHQKLRKKADPTKAFSIIGRAMTLEFEASTVEEHKAWVDALNAVLHCVRKDQQWLKGSSDQEAWSYYTPSPAMRSSVGSSAASVPRTSSVSSKLAPISSGAPTVGAASTSKSHRNAVVGKAAAAEPQPSLPPSKPTPSEAPKAVSIKATSPEKLVQVTPSAAPATLQTVTEDIAVDNLASVMDEKDETQKAPAAGKVESQPAVQTDIPLDQNKTDPIVLARAREAYDEAIKNGGSAPWLRSKLMMVGEGRAGKTSTVRSFLNKQFDADLASTIGADTNLLCWIERHERVVQWKERETGNEFATMAARAVAQTIRNDKPDELAFGLIRQASVQMIVESSADDSGEAPQPRRRSFSERIMGSFRRGSEATRRPSKPLEPPDRAPSEKNLERVSSVRAQPMTFLEPLTKKEKGLWTRPEEEVAREFDSELVSAALDEESDKDIKRKLSLSIWDYGGQEVFYALHHVFLTRFGCYCVVFDMVKFVNQDTHEQTLAMLDFWLKSIRMHAPNAPVFIVGTHKDMVPSPKEHADISLALQAKLKVSTNPQVQPISEKGLPVKNILWFYPIDNSKGSAGDPLISMLRESILDAVREEDYVKMAVPISWIKVLDLLLAKRKTNPYVTTTEAAQIAASVGVARVAEMFAFFNELGVLVYFDLSTDLRRLVILDPQWLIDRLTKVIRDFNIHTFDEDILRDKKIRAMFSLDWERLQTRGIVTKKLLDHFWNQDSEATRHFLIALMKRMSLLCDWVSDEDNAEESFLVPSLFESSATLCTLPEFDRTIKPVAFFELSFKDFFLPRGLFPRLVALVATHAIESFKNSVPPFLTRTRAIVSFGEMDFVLENRLESNAIRVGVLEKRFVPAILEKLESMVESLREEVMGKELKMSVLLLISNGSGLLPVAKTVARKAFDDQFKHRIRAANGELLSAKALMLFFQVEEEESRETELSPLQEVFSVPLLSGPIKHHAFLSYSQQTAMGACDALALKFKTLGFTVWFDQFHEGELTEQAMMEGVVSSKVFLLFLSKGVLTRPFCVKEARMAVQEMKPIIFVHEEDRRFGFAEIYEMKDEAPDDLKHLFDTIESIPFRRRIFEADNMMAQIGRRIQRVFETGRE